MPQFMARYLFMTIQLEGDEPAPTKLITNQPEIEDQINKFYTELYRKREAQYKDSDLKGFMGDKGYNMFQNCARKKFTICF